MNCPGCNKPLPVGAKGCPACGRPAGAAREVAPAAVRPPTRRTTRRYPTRVFSKPTRPRPRGIPKALKTIGSILGAVIVVTIIGLRVYKAYRTVPKAAPPTETLEETFNLEPKQMRTCTYNNSQFTSANYVLDVTASGPAAIAVGMVASKDKLSDDDQRALLSHGRRIDASTRGLAPIKLERGNFAWIVMNLDEKSPITVRLKFRPATGNEGPTPPPPPPPAYLVDRSVVVAAGKTTAGGLSIDLATALAFEVKAVRGDVKISFGQVNNPGPPTDAEVTSLRRDSRPVAEGTTSTMRLTPTPGHYAWIVSNAGVGEAEAIVKIRKGS